MKLTTQQFQRLIEALLDAYPIPVQLAQMMTTRLGKNLYAFATTGAYETDIYQVIVNSEAQGWTPKLVAAARESRPGNAILLDFSAQYGIAATSVSGGALERLIREGKSLLDVSRWRSRLGEVEFQICRVEVPLKNGKSFFGTGFLVGPDVIMTNYHVIEPLLPKQNGNNAGQEPKALPGDVTLLFDYKVTEDGITLNEGTSYQLAGDEWLVASSPYSEVDKLIEPGEQVPTPEELDFALLRVDGSPGEDTIGNKVEPGAPKRGYIPVPTQPYLFEKDADMYIMQHPKGSPLKLAIESKAVDCVNQNGTRVRYRVETDHGSSGSPCFNQNWELVALHHSGDPDYSQFHKPTYNQGIPVSAIRNYLKKIDREYEVKDN